MTSSRRVALSLILVAACGGALISFLPSARGQNVAVVQNASVGSAQVSGTPTSGGSTTSSGVATTGGATTGTGSTGTGPIPLKHVIGIAPVQIRPKQLLVEIIGGTGNESEENDLQLKNIYSLLQQRGVAIPNILHPYSTAKPSFIVERLIVLSINGGNSTSTTGGTNTPDSSRGGSGDTGGTAQTPAGPTAAQSTISDVHRFVDAELTRGSGRLGGAHRRKLQLLSEAIGRLETANSIGAAISSAVGGDARGGGSSGGTGTGDKVDPREILYGQVRLTARAADRYVPVPSSYQ